MATERIKAEVRTAFGKGAARRIRREGNIPAVVYGHGNEPIHLTLPGHDTQMAIKHGGANALLEIEVDGKDQLALTKQVQASPILRIIEHIDFVTVKRGQKVHVDVPIHVVGEVADDDGVAMAEVQAVEIEAEATHIPEYIEVDVEGAEIGAQIFARDLVLPDGSTLYTDPEDLIVHVTEVYEEPEPEPEEGEEGAEDEESEGGESEGEESEGGDNE